LPDHASGGRFCIKAPVLLGFATLEQPPDHFFVVSVVFLASGLENNLHFVIIFGNFCFAPQNGADP
jgi:hypothetical protein